MGDDDIDGLELERDEFPATQFYEAAEDALDLTEAPFESFNVATQAYDFSNQHFDAECADVADAHAERSDTFLATQVYLDDIDPCADTLQYNDEPGLGCEPISVPEMMATQAYAEIDEIDQVDQIDVEVIPDEAEALREVCVDEVKPVSMDVPSMPPPMVPDRLKRKKTDGEVSKLQHLDLTMAASPMRSPRRPILDEVHEVLHVEDSPPKSFSKRRRLTGKQPPPMPNPFQPVTAASEPIQPATSRKAGRRPKVQKVYIAMTGFVLEKGKRDQLQKIPGVNVVDEWSAKVTHVIAKGFRRTSKLMCAVCKGLHIVVPKFIDECITAGEIIDEKPFLLHDNMAEAAFAEKHQLPSFSLQTSVQRARSEGALLRNRSVYWTDGSEVEQRELKDLVVAAGGRWLKRKPRKLEAEVSIPKSFWLGHDFDPELLREAACTQVLRWDTYRLWREWN